MTLVVLVAVVWTLLLVVLIGLCRSAAAGDREMREQIARRRRSHEYPLAG